MKSWGAGRAGEAGADVSNPLSCGHNHGFEGTARVPPNPSDERATSNVTDLRRARQHARAVLADIRDAITAWMAANQVKSRLNNPAQVRRLNREMTEIASERLQEELVAWLDQRHRITMGRAARQAFDRMRGSLPDDVDDDQLREAAHFTNRDREVLRRLRNIDAGLLYDTELAEELGLGQPLAEELGDDVTRQLRLGHDQGETVQELAERVRLVIEGGDRSERQERGITGQTKRTKAELIAHDSIQDSYNTSARKRYLRNGFRYAVFDATIDTKTSAVCRRMNEWVIDMVETPFFIPPLHPYCRSGIRPILDIGDRTVLSRDDVADGFLQTIFATKSYRPPVVGEGEFRPTPLSEQFGQARKVA